MPGRSALLVVLAITWSSSAMPASPKHLGVASCASSVCHGSVKARSVTRIPQNEYVIWSRHDRHRNAYKTLLTPASRRIAANLGLANAHEADVCLDCHADNVPPAQRGERFQINDGVTCEACHGGAGAYIDSHTQKHLSHADRVESGLLPIDDIDVRAALCFSCHLGNADKSADHRIMGAGHPRLSFELDTFSVLQPAHYVVDEDYLAEKWAGDHLVTWVQGQISAARHTLSQIEGTVLRKDAVFPELSMFDCHACHHSLDDIRWQQQSRIMLPPGTIRLNDVGFLMLLPITRVIVPEMATPLEQQIVALHRATLKPAELEQAIIALARSLATLQREIQPAKLTGTGSKLLQAIVQMGRDGIFRDYAAAEQAVIAIDLLLNQTAQRHEAGAWVEQMYRAVAVENGFSAAALRSVMGQFPGKGGGSGEHRDD